MYKKKKKKLIFNFAAYCNNYVKKEKFFKKKTKFNYAKIKSGCYISSILDQLEFFRSIQHVKNIVKAFNYHFYLVEFTKIQSAS